MKCVLTVIDGPAAGRTAAVAHGAPATFGRSDRAVHRFPDDELMSALHCEVRCEQNEIVLKDLGSTNGTFVNGERVAQRTLAAGDLLQCGNTTFRVGIELDAPPGRQSSPDERRTVLNAPPAVEQPALDAAVSGYVAPRALEVFERFELKPDAFAPVDEKTTAEQLVKQLADQGRLTEALQFLSHALPKRCAVWWASQCVRRGFQDKLTENDARALAAAEAWVVTPEEQQRRDAMAVADSLGHGTAAAWAAVGAFWSGGSMAPPDAPVIPPAENFTGKAVFGAVQMSAVAVEPQKAAEKQKAFVELAQRIARGENTWNQAAAPAG